jgi:hypothetical protein
VRGVPTANLGKSASIISIGVPAGEGQSPGR